MASAITDYATLSTSINEWAVRNYTQGQLDQFIGLAEGEFRLKFGPNFALETGAASVTFTDGIGALPAGFLRPLSLTVSGIGPVTFTGLAAIRSDNLFGGSGNPSLAAISGSSIITAPKFTGTGSLDYEGSLVGLSGTNTTNWLVTNAPQAYLSMCLSVAYAFNEIFDKAQLYEGKAMQTLNDLGIQSMVGQQARASVRIPGATP